MQDRLVRFQLFGQEFTFYSNASEEEVDSVIALLREELESGDTFSRSSVPSSKMLVLGCLRMAAKYIQLHREFDAYRQTQATVLVRLIDKVASGLD
ncbi:cell division protein ZapA [Desulfobulbus elongatus]|uniref:cell division protein ZapA n=1 Tax=Desulfobulbus elongatus TaxID=53332 RepID=UPI000480EA80|nr:cell division protein ZapA [Desulfobulbus elongatus]